MTRYESPTGLCYRTVHRVIDDRTLCGYPIERMRRVTGPHPGQGCRLKAIGRHELCGDPKDAR